MNYLKYGGVFAALLSLTSTATSAGNDTVASESNTREGTECIKQLEHFEMDSAFYELNEISSKDDVLRNHFTGIHLEERDGKKFLYGTKLDFKYGCIFESSDERFPVISHVFNLHIPEQNELYRWELQLARELDQARSRDGSNLVESGHEIELYP